MKYKDNQCAMDAKNYKHIIDIKMSQKLEKKTSQNDTKT